jgi:hypothetical protein
VTTFGVEDLGIPVFASPHVRWGSAIMSEGTLISPRCIFLPELLVWVWRMKAATEYPPAADPYDSFERVLGVPFRRQPRATLGYVGFGGDAREITGRVRDLGIGVERPKRGWLWHFSFGYVSGFPVPSIFYYLLTRHTTARMAHWYWRREHAAFTARTGQPWERCHADECKKCGPRSPQREGD